MSNFGKHRIGHAMPEHEPVGTRRGEAEAACAGRFPVEQLSASGTQPIAPVIGQLNAHRIVPEQTTIGRIRFDSRPHVAQGKPAGVAQVQKHGKGRHRIGNRRGEADQAIAVPALCTYRVVFVEHIGRIAGLQQEQEQEGKEEMHRTSCFKLSNPFQLNIIRLRVIPDHFACWG